MSTTIEPWASHGEPAGFGWESPTMAPGAVAALRRMEAAERAEERRADEERATRAADRFDVWHWHRRQQLTFRGQPFDPSDLSTMVRTPEQLAAEVFAVQDVEAARAERRRWSKPAC
jgi:hypothetical protein